MKIINEMLVLKEKIALLREKKASDLAILKQQYYKTIDDFNPTNPLKITTEEFIVTPNLKLILYNKIISFVSSIISKNILNNNTTNPINQTLGKQ